MSGVEPIPQAHPGPLSIPVPDLSRAIPDPGDTPGPPFDPAFLARVALSGRGAQVDRADGETDRVVIGGRTVAERRRIAGAVTVSERSTVRCAERVLRLGDVAVTERVVVPWDGSYSLVQWTARDRDGADVELRWEVPAGTGRIVARSVSDRALAVEWGDGFRAVQAFSRPVPIALNELDGGGLAITARPTVDRESIRLVSAAGPSDRAVGRSLRAAARPSAVARSREANARRLAGDALFVACSDPTVSGALERAKLALTLTPPPTELGPAAIADALARLAIGDRDTVREALGRLAETGSVAGPVAAAASAVIAGAYLAWTGDAPALADAWTALEGVPETLSTPDAASLPRSLRSAALSAIFGVAETLNRSGRVMGIEREVGPTTAEPAGARADVAGWTASAKETPAGTICGLVLGTLGVDPDAPRGRIALAPRPPAGWTRLSAGRIRVGAAAVAVELTFSDGRCRIVARQEMGSVPLTLILAPELPGRLAAARVDGLVADLDPEPIGPRSRVPVQLVLDHARTVELEMEPQYR